ncbi:hypothetical protein FD723_40060 (plasmid) [Nostoc sp. C052]|uniref:hypothetical protein n=1 Tax=Nostoc sp. C052 TaxID=2576902 RepID=UPI0015C30717|nr:hypothetical protein [Nostoc sp. C052]QLE46409.1 hypothetical protein FD723_40060 [Nostoc sp. C052]
MVAITHSLTNNGIAQDNPFAFYESPSWFVTELLRHWRLFGVIGEPCVGNGAIASLLLAWDNTDSIWTNDLDTEKVAHFHRDATLAESWDFFPECDFVVTNPPYKDKAAPIIKHAFEKARIGVAAFLLTSFLEPCEDRALFLEEHPPSLVLTMPRYSFRKDKAGLRWSTDNITISCFIWDKRTTKQQIIIRPSERIFGYYKNPEKAISQEAASDIVRQIANGAITKYW